MINNIFDTHAHYDDEAFAADRDTLLAAMPSLGVSKIINSGCDVQSSQAAMRISEKHSHVYFTAGFHPQNLSGADDESFEKIKHLLQHKKCVAIGEIGLDYYYIDLAPKNVQLLWLERQLELAQATGMPVVLHDRDAHEDILKTIKKYNLTGVMHCFSGSAQMAREVAAMGLHIGLGGVATFKNARRALEAASAVPLGKILLETDAPYLAPVPYRGKRCDSSMIAKTAEVLAQHLGLEVQQLVNQCTKNAEELFLKAR